MRQRSSGQADGPGPDDASRPQPSPSALFYHPQVLDSWYKNDIDKKGLVLMVTSGKEGAVTGGKAFVSVSGCQAGLLVRARLFLLQLSASQTARPPPSTR